MDHQNGNILNITLLKKLNTFILKGQFWLFSEHPPPWSWTSFRFESHAEILRNKTSFVLLFFYVAFLSPVYLRGSVVLALCCAVMSTDSWACLSLIPLPQRTVTLFIVSLTFFLFWLQPGSAQRRGQPVCIHQSVCIVITWSRNRPGRSLSSDGHWTEIRFFFFTLLSLMLKRERITVEFCRSIEVMWLYPCLKLLHSIDSIKE